MPAKRNERRADKAPATNKDYYYEYTAYNLLFLQLLERRDWLALDSTKFQLFFKDFDVANAGEEMRLTIAIAIESCEPSCNVCGEFHFSYPNMSTSKTYLSHFHSGVSVSLK